MLKYPINTAGSLVNIVEEDIVISCVTVIVVRTNVTTM